MSVLFRRPASFLSTSLRTTRHFRTSVAPHIKETGLYGFDLLKTPKDFRRFVDEAFERSGELVNYIAGMPSAPEIIRAMDDMSDAVCSVIDSAELCRHTHPNREFVEEAMNASLRINEYLHYLNTNHTLYKAVLKAEKDGHLLTKEARRAAHYLRLDFERAGIHLPSDKLDQVNRLNLDIVQLSRKFNENVITDLGHVDVFPASRIPKKLHHLVKPVYRPGPIDSVKEKGYQIVTEPSTLSSVLQWASDAEVRRMAYIRGNSVPSANVVVLDKLVTARHDLAQIMGYNSYAEFALHTNMASSPDVVKSFLLELSSLVRPKADKEFEAIQKFKRGKNGQLYGDVEPWDEAYFGWLMKSSVYDLDSSAIASYFPLPNCIEGLKILVESLFGVTVHRIPLAPGESWHPSVIKMSLHHPVEGDLGYLYLDLTSRRGKYPICAHFAIRGGRRLSETEYQLPVVALVCNFPGSNDSLSTRLNHWELETLFHEFGHALHSLLSRTDYQHFSGTRVALDFAETPSNLFEYYAWDYRVLRKFARHFSTGDVIPERLVESMCGAKNMFAATELQRQIFYSLIDQTLYGENPSEERDTISMVADLKRKHTSWKHVEGTHWHTRFTHLVNYGAGYYSYLYAKCFAATIWQKICQEDPLSIRTGSLLRTEFLQHGGSKDAASILTDFVGDGILRLHGKGIVPDVTCLSNEFGLMKA